MSCLCGFVYSSKLKTSRLFKTDTALGRARLAISLIFAINGFLYANWTSRIPRLQELYQIDNAQLGFVLLAMSLGALVTMPLTGYIIVKVGSRKLTSIMLFAFILACPFLAFMPAYTALLVLGVLIGMSTGSLDIAMNAQAIIVEDGLKKPIMSSFHAIFSMGMLAGAATASGFIALGADVMTHLPAVSLFSILVALWCIRQLLADDPAANAVDGVSSSSSGSGFQFHRIIVLLGLAAFCCMMGEGAMADWTPVYMLRITGSPEQWAPIGQAAFSGAMMMGRLGGDWARARFGSLSLIRNGGLLALAGLSLALFFPFPVTAFLGFLLVGLGLSNIVPIAYSISGKVPGVAPSVGISSVTTIGYAGFLFGPPVIGFISDWHNEAMARGINPVEWWMNGSWRGLQFGLGFIWLLFVMLVIIALFFLRIDDKKLPDEPGDTTAFQESIHQLG